MAAPAVENLPAHSPCEFCWNCGQLGRYRSALFWGCDTCQVQWRGYEDHPGPLDSALWIGRLINCVDFAPRKDWSKDSLFTDPRIPGAPA